MRRVIGVTAFLIFFAMLITGSYAMVQGNSKAVKQFVQTKASYFLAL